MQQDVTDEVAKAIEVGAAQDCHVFHSPLY